ncbi:MAG: tRNA (adenosine(37)-N6)-threonylcarbamoyltransferase complex dimerization subunit type 1 TsaB [Pseudomonadota bacterium]
MSIILAIELSTDMASVALHGGESTIFRSGTCCISRQASGVQNHSQTILPMVQALLTEAGIGLSGCDAVAFGAGPGSFTGVRTACGIAQGLAYGCDLPVLAVDTLAATALACRHATKAVRMNDILVVLDARMGEVYWGQYRWPETIEDRERGIDNICESWEVVVSPRLSTPAAVMPVGVVTACGNAFTVHAAALAACPIEGTCWPALMPHASQIAILAQRLFAKGKAVTARDAQPIYLRNDIALTTAERERKQLEATV